MINIDTLHSKVQALINKAQGGGYLSDSEFDEYINMASLDLFNTLFEEFQRTEKITDMVRAFITTTTIVADSFGKASYPNDYRYLLSAPRTYDNKALKEMLNIIEFPTAQDYARLSQQDIKEIDNDKIGNRTTSDIFKPSDELPICTIYNTFIQVRPLNIGYVIIDYLRAPAVMKWGSVIDPVTNLPVYNPSTSVDCDWSEVAENKLILKTCSYFGVQVREQELYAVTEQLNAQDTV